MGLSDRTKTSISGANKVEEQLADFAFDPGATPVYRLNKDEVPTTTEDMTALFQWEHGETVRGTQAKVAPGMDNYIKDIDRAWGKEADYDKNMIFINTFLERKPVSEQLTALK